MKSHELLAQADLKLIFLISASQVARITGLSHCAQLRDVFFKTNF
jgi:hypothetical protein